MNSRFVEIIFVNSEDRTLFIYCFYVYLMEIQYGMHLHVLWSYYVRIFRNVCWKCWMQLISLQPEKWEVWLFVIMRGHIIVLILLYQKACYFVLLFQFLRSMWVVKGHTVKMVPLKCTKWLYSSVCKYFWFDSLFFIFN